MKSGKGVCIIFDYPLFLLIRGAETKTELSLVDKIELARAYKSMTGDKVLLNILTQGRRKTEAGKGTNLSHLKISPQFKD